MTIVEPPLNALVYLSTIDNGLTLDQGKEIITRRSEVYKSLNVTGLLVYSGGNLLRLIEGEKSTLQELYDHARLEPQHHVLKLYFGAIPHRYFSDYPLAVKIMDGDLKPLDNFQSPEMREYWDELLSMDSAVTNLIKDFIKNNC